MATEEKTYELMAQPRTEKGKHSARLLRQGILPGVVYGHNVTPEAVQVPLREFEHIYLRAGSTTLVDLKVGDGAPRKVFVHEVQRAPSTHKPVHVDFIAVNLREEMTASVAVVLQGTSPAAEGGDGLLLQLLEHVSVKALPAKIPHAVEVDISNLKEVDQSIRVGDLTFGDDVTVLTPEDEIIVRVSSKAHAIAEEEVEVEEAAPEGEEGEAAEGEAAEGGATEGETEES